MIEETEQTNQNFLVDAKVTWADWSHSETYESYCRHSGGIYLEGTNRCITGPYELFEYGDSSEINPYLLLVYIIALLLVISCIIYIKRCFSDSKLKNVFVVVWFIILTFIILSWGVLLRQIFVI